MWVVSIMLEGRRVDFSPILQMSLHHETLGHDQGVAALRGIERPIKEWWTNMSSMHVANCSAMTLLSMLVSWTVRNEINARVSCIPVRGLVPPLSMDGCRRKFGGERWRCPKAHRFTSLIAAINRLQTGRRSFPHRSTM